MATSHRSTGIKSSRFYITVLLLWAPLVGALLYSVRGAIIEAHHDGVAVGLMVDLSIAFIAYFWLNGMKDIAYTLFYHLWLKDYMVIPPVHQWTAGKMPLVALLYTACNDFCAEALLTSMRQDYGNYYVVILDDSNKPESLAEIDAFSAQYGVQVIRRENRVGFKAGNVNHGLDKLTETQGWDYFVLLDSDERMPSDGVSRLMDWCMANPKAGIVQATHKASGDRNGFMRMFSRGVDAHWPTYQGVKARYGFMSLLGHGAIVSRICYEAAGRFPHTVAEDISLAIEARVQGFYTLFAHNVVCFEEFPLNYMAFEKRHRKWTGGNLEFIRLYTWRIIRAKMHWYEKLDIVLFTYALPLTGLFSLYVVMNVYVFPLMGYSFTYPLWMLIPTVSFLVAPMLNDIICNWKMPKRKLLSYLVHSTLLYGSMLYVSIDASIRAAIGGSKFHVTPKSGTSTTFRETLRFNLSKLLFGVGAAATATAVAGSSLPMVLISSPAMGGLYLATMHNDEEYPETNIEEKELTLVD